MQCFSCFGCNLSIHTLSLRIGEYFPYFAVCDNLAFTSIYDLLDGVPNNLKNIFCQFQSHFQFRSTNIKTKIYVKKFGVKVNV